MRLGKCDVGTLIASESKVMIVFEIIPTAEACMVPVGPEFMA